MVSHHNLTRSFIIICLFLFSVALVSSSSETEALLSFKTSLKANSLPSWDQKETPCNGSSANWAGLLCDEGRVWGIRLERMGLSGTINFETLWSLRHLRTVSFMNNDFEGPIPQVKNLSSLRSVFLSHNKFSGEIKGDAFEGMSYLRKIYLSGNKFTGAIPNSLASLPKLLKVRLDGNQFSGVIPEFKAVLQLVNVSNNALTGAIPASLSKMNPSLFAGNKDLCGAPLSPCSSASKPSRKAPVPAIVIAVVVTMAAIIGLAAAVYAMRGRRRAYLSLETPPSDLQKKVEGGLSHSSRHSSRLSSRRSSRSSSIRKENNMKLSFVSDETEKFELQDLLKSNAEILGSGCFGVSFKATLSSNNKGMVVKRFKQMNNVGREEFQEHMRRLGKLTHPNLLPLVAYYYRKEEKLIVSDFVSRGSLAVHLHGNVSKGEPSLEWSSRLKIIKGVAQALQYLYTELPSLITPHGHLKSSNVVLNENFEPLLTDYGLVPVINQESAQELMAAYKSPEYIQNGRVTKKTDVWGLGILILEIVTGKFPSNFSQNEKGSNEEDLATWVSSIPSEDWMSEVVDKEMEVTGETEGDVVNLLKIGLCCCDIETEKRLDITEAVEKIERLKD